MAPGITGGTAQAAGGLSWRSRCCSSARAFPEQTHLLSAFTLLSLPFSFLLSSTSFCLHPNVQTQLQFSGRLLTCFDFICSHARNPWPRRRLTTTRSPMRAAAARPVYERGQLLMAERQTAQSEPFGPVRCVWPRSLSQRRPSTRSSVDCCADGECRDAGEIRLTLLLAVAGASDHQISPRQVERGWQWSPRLVASRPFAPSPPF